MQLHACPPSSLSLNHSTILCVTGGRVDGVLANALDAASAAVRGSSSASSSGDADSSSSSSCSFVSSSDTAVAARCWQLLQGMRYSLLYDLWLLREDARVQGESTSQLDHLVLEQVRWEQTGCVLNACKCSSGRELKAMKSYKAYTRDESRWLCIVQRCCSSRSET